MSKRVTVTALRAVLYQDRHYETGDSFKVAPVEALILARRRDVSLSTGPRLRTRALIPEPTPPPPRRPRRSRKTAPDEHALKTPTYRRRDLVPESHE